MKTQTRKKYKTQKSTPELYQIVWNTHTIEQRFKMWLKGIYDSVRFFPEEKSPQLVAKKRRGRPRKDRSFDAATNTTYTKSTAWEL
jgi:hypothetical protein